MITFLLENPTDRRPSRARKKMDQAEPEKGGATSRLTYRMSSSYKESIYRRFSRLPFV